MKLHIAPVEASLLLPYEQLARQHGTSIRATGNAYAVTTHYLAAFDSDADNALVGFGGMRFLPDKNIIAGRSYFVMPDYRRHGIAMTLWYLLMRSCSAYAGTDTIYHGAVNPSSAGGTRMVQRFDMDFVGRIAANTEEFDVYRLGYHDLIDMFPDETAYMGCEFDYQLAQPILKPSLRRIILPNGQIHHRVVDAAQWGSPRT